MQQNEFSNKEVRVRFWSGYELLYKNVFKNSIVPGQNSVQIFHTTWSKYK
jgi:hypothetical protein